MNIKCRRKLNKFRKSLIKAWYWSMKPVANYLTNREDNTYKKIRENITEDEAAKLIAKDLVKWIVKLSSPLKLMIAEYVDHNDVHSCYSFNGNNLYFKLKNKKAKIAFYKFKKSTDFQIKVLYELHKIKGMSVHKTGWQPERWMNIKEFEGLYEIKVDE